MSVTSLKKLRQKDYLFSCNFKASLGYVVRLCLGKERERGMVVGYAYNFST